MFIVIELWLFESGIIKKNYVHGVLYMYFIPASKYDNKHIFYDKVCTPEGNVL